MKDFQKPFQFWVHPGLVAHGLYQIRLEMSISNISGYDVPSQIGKRHETVVSDAVVYVYCQLKWEISLVRAIFVTTVAIWLLLKLISKLIGTCRMRPSLSTCLSSHTISHMRSYIKFLRDFL